MISPAMISPAAGGTKLTDPGTGRSPGGQAGVMGVSSLNSTF